MFSANQDVTDVAYFQEEQSPYLGLSENDATASAAVEDANGDATRTTRLLHFRRIVAESQSNVLREGIADETLDYIETDFYRLVKESTDLIGTQNDELNELEYYDAAMTIVLASLFRRCRNRRALRITFIKTLQHLLIRKDGDEVMPLMLHLLLDSNHSFDTVFQEDGSGLLHLPSLLHTARIFVTEQERKLLLKQQSLYSVQRASTKSDWQLSLVYVISRLVLDCVDAQQLMPTYTVNQLVDDVSRLCFFFGPVYIEVLQRRTAVSLFLLDAFVADPMGPHFRRTRYNMNIGFQNALQPNLLLQGLTLGSILGESFPVWTAFQNAAGISYSTVFAIVADKLEFAQNITPAEFCKVFRKLTVYFDKYSFIQSLTPDRRDNLPMDSRADVLQMQEYSVLPSTNNLAELFNWRAYRSRPAYPLLMYINYELHSNQVCAALEQARAMEATIIDDNDKSAAYQRIFIYLLNKNLLFYIPGVVPIQDSILYTVAPYLGQFGILYFTEYLCSLLKQFSTPEAMQLVTDEERRYLRKLCQQTLLSLVAQKVKPLDHAIAVFEEYIAESANGVIETVPTGSSQLRQQWAHRILNQRIEVPQSLVHAEKSPMELMLARLAPQPQQETFVDAIEIDEEFENTDDMEVDDEIERDEAGYYDTVTDNEKALDDTSTNERDSRYLLQQDLNELDQETTEKFQQESSRPEIFADTNEELESARDKSTSVAEEENVVDFGEDGQNFFEAEEVAASQSENDSTTSDNSMHLQDHYNDVEDEIKCDDSNKLEVVAEGNNDDDILGSETKATIGENSNETVMVEVHFDNEVLNSDHNPINNESHSSDEDSNKEHTNASKIDYLAEVIREDNNDDAVTNNELKAAVEFENEIVNDSADSDNITVEASVDNELHESDELMYGEEETDSDLRDDEASVSENVMQAVAFQNNSDQSDVDDDNQLGKSSECDNFNRSEPTGEEYEFTDAIVVDQPVNVTEANDVFDAIDKNVESESGSETERFDREVDNDNMLVVNNAMSDDESKVTSGDYIDNEMEASEAADSDGIDDFKISEGSHVKELENIDAETNEPEYGSTFERIAADKNYDADSTSKSIALEDVSGGVIDITNSSKGSHAETQSTPANKVTQDIETYSKQTFPLDDGKTVEDVGGGSKLDSICEANNNHGLIAFGDAFNSLKTADEAVSVVELKDVGSVIKDTELALISHEGLRAAKQALLTDEIVQEATTEQKGIFSYGHDNAVDDRKNDMIVDEYSGVVRATDVGLSNVSSGLEEGYEAEESQGPTEMEEDEELKNSSKSQASYQHSSNRANVFPKTILPVEEGYDAEESQGHTEAEEDEEQSLKKRRAEQVSYEDANSVRRNVESEQQDEMITEMPKAYAQLDPGYEAEDSQEEENLSTVIISTVTRTRTETGYEAGDSQGHSDEEEVSEAVPTDEEAKESEHSKPKVQTESMLLIMKTSLSTGSPNKLIKNAEASSEVLARVLGMNELAEEATSTICKILQPIPEEVCTEINFLRQNSSFSVLESTMTERLEQSDQSFQSGASHVEWDDDKIKEAALKLTHQLGETIDTIFSAGESVTAEAAVQRESVNFVKHNDERCDDVNDKDYKLNSSSQPIRRRRRINITIASDSEDESSSGRETTSAADAYASISRVKKNNEAKKISVHKASRSNDVAKPRLHQKVNNKELSTASGNIIVEDAGLCVDEAQSKETFVGGVELISVSKTKRKNVLVDFDELSPTSTKKQKLDPSLQNLRSKVASTSKPRKKIDDEEISKTSEIDSKQSTGSSLKRSRSKKVSDVVIETLATSNYKRRGTPSNEVSSVETKRKRSVPESDEKSISSKKSVASRTRAKTRVVQSKEQSSASKSANKFTKESSGKNDNLTVRRKDLESTDDQSATSSHVKHGTTSKAASTASTPIRSRRTKTTNKGGSEGTPATTPRRSARLASPRRSARLSSPRHSARLKE